jgi:hypothetical protein
MKAGKGAGSMPMWYFLLRVEMNELFQRGISSHLDGQLLCC